MTSVISDGGTRSQSSARLLVVRVKLLLWLIGKSVSVMRESERVDPSGEAKWGGGSPRKSSKLMIILPVPQTDTGRQVENTKVFERTLVKELGKLTP